MAARPTRTSSGAGSLHTGGPAGAPHSPSNCAPGRARSAFSGLSFGVEESIGALFKAKAGMRWSDGSKAGYQYFDPADGRCHQHLTDLVLWVAGRNSARRPARPLRPSRRLARDGRAAAPQALRSSTRTAA